MARTSLLVTRPAPTEERRLLDASLPADLDPTYLDDLTGQARREAVADAEALLSRLPHLELDDEAFAGLHEGQVMQATSAGVDHLPLDRFPEGFVLLSNAGAYAEPMAEHVLAMYLALCKRLRTEHEHLRDGQFNQFDPTRQVEGSTVTIFGYGAIGQASARLLRRVGVTVLGINRSGEADEPAADLGRPDDLERFLARSDGLVVAAPLTRETRGCIDRETLSWLPDDGVFINVARGEIVDQDDLYAHLVANPAFQAGIDAWWREPVRHGEFEMDHPFLDLPNVLGSPHNSAQVPGTGERGLRHAVGNLVSTLETGTYRNRVDLDLGY